MANKGQKRRGSRGKAKPSAGAKRHRPGFSYSTSDKNTFPTPNLLSTKRFKIKLLAGQNANADTLTFVLRSHPFELVRLLPQPIRIKYVASQPTPNKQAADPERSYLTASTAGNDILRAYIDPFTAASTFFSSADVVLDNFSITDHLPPQGRLHGFYQQAIKSFMGEDAKNAIYGGSLTIPDETVRNALTTSEMKEALKTMEFDSKTDPVARTISLGFDGVPLLGPARNYQLSKLQGREPPQTFSYLPPETSLLIRLFRQRPDHHSVEIVDGTNRSDDDYFKHADLAVDVPDIQFEIKEIYLMAESARVAPRDMEKLRHNYAKSPLHFLMDVPVPSYQNVPAGLSEADITFMLEKGTQLVYVFFITQHQIFLSKTSKKTCSFRVPIPPSLKQIRFFYGADELHFDQGLSKLHGTNVAGNLDVLAFETYLRQRGWVDERYAKLFPRSNNNGYRSFFPLDLTAFDTRGGGRELRANLRFMDAGSANGLLCASIRVVEGEFVRRVEMGTPKWSVAANLAEHG